MIPMNTIKGLYNNVAGLQVGTKLPGEITRDAKGNYQFDMEGIAFLQQMGIEWVMVADVPEHTAQCYKEVKDALAEHGLKIYRLQHYDLHNMSEVTLNLEGRDRKIERYLQYIDDLGQAGIKYATYAHMGNGIWRSDKRYDVRGGAKAGGFDFEVPNRSIAFGDYEWPLSHGREYTEDEIWGNYEHFIKQVVPVAESAGVYIGIHPDDPPAYKIAGVPRCIFSGIEGYKRAFEIANSKNIGACLCVGCWLEGGTDLMGCSVEEFIDWLAKNDKLFKLHVRNVTAPICAKGGTHETFPDAGYGNMANVVRKLKEVGFDGCIMNDHLVDMVGGFYASEAYFTAYLKGLVDGIK